MVPGPVGEAFGPACLVISSLTTMSRQERSRPFTKPDIPWLVGGLALLFILSLLLRRFAPEERWEPLTRAIRHPLIVVPFWSAGILLMFRQWRRGRSAEHGS